MASSRAFVVPTAEVVDEAPLTFIAPEAGVQSSAFDSSLRRQLYDDFFRNDILENQRISLDEFIQRLKKSTLHYDEASLQKIYASASSISREESPTGHRLVDAYVKRVRELRGLILLARQELTRLDELIRHSENNLHKAEASERMTAGTQVPEDSILTVQVVSARGLDKNKSVVLGDMFKLHLECQQQAIETEFQPLEAGEVFWNAMFSFVATEKEQGLSIGLFKEKQEQCCSECAVLLDELADQRKVEMAKELWGAVKGELRISCQWIYSRKLLYQSFLREFMAKREVKSREWLEAKLEFQKLCRPFGLGVDNGTWAKIWANIRGGPDNLSASIDYVLDHIKLSNFQRALLVLFTIYVILTAITCSSRPAFLDLLLGIYGIWCCQNHSQRWTITVYNGVATAAVLSLCYDILWMSVFFSEPEENGLSRAEMNLRTVTKVFSLFNFLWKILILIFLWKCRYDLSRKNTGNRAPHRERLLA